MSFNDSYCPNSSADCRTRNCVHGYDESVKRCNSCGVANPYVSPLGYCNSCGNLFEFVGIFADATFPFAPAEKRSDWGGYPFAYYMGDGGTLCADCMNDPTNPVHIGGDSDGWDFVGRDTREGSPEDYDGEIYCDHCNSVIVGYDS